MTSQHTTHTTDPAASASALTDAPDVRPITEIIGRYHARIERLDAAGLAHGTAIEALLAPNWSAAEARGIEPAPPLEHVAVVGALPGEVVEVEARWRLPWPGRKRKRLKPPTLRVTRVIEAAPERVAAPCPVFGVCGGCQLQHMDYAAQLAWKTDRMRTLLADAGFVNAPVNEMIGCDPPWNYRNHMRFSVDRAGRVGLTARGTSRVLPLTRCDIAAERINDALAVLARHELPRPQALVRYGAGTGQMLLQPASSGGLREEVEALGIELRDQEFEEELAGHRFRIRPSSFFQTNTSQANVMARLALEALPSGNDVTLVDAYCGVGTFARLMAERAGRVLAIEESESAIRDARANLADAPNVEIVKGKVETILPGMTERLDGLVIDPPRAGCQRFVLDALIARHVARVVYISCGPESLTRDLAILCRESGAYSLVSLQPLDMFPQTAHIENIAVLEAVETIA
ncbi:MAG TPA: class I SAM-dependent RNA methyltransferase [Ktedonobacterales bacterium]|jgi:23S rRNA (uracil1939-C5)-methyltransferase